MATITRVKSQNARIVTGTAGTVLCSYVVPVVAAVDGRLLVSKSYHEYSNTTSRHIRNFTRDYGVPAELVEHDDVAAVLRSLVGRDCLDPM